MIGCTQNESYIASDAPAILDHTRSVYYMDNLEMGCVLPGKVHFYDLNSDERDRNHLYAERGGKGWF